MTEQAPTSRLRASAHPVRLRILSLLTGAELSAAEVARELGLTHANASYHLRQLADADLIVVAGEEKVRGGVAKRYRYRWEDPGPMRGGRGSDEDRAMFLRAAAEELVRRGALWRRGGPERDHPPSHASDAEVWVPEDVWKRVCELLVEAGTLVHERARPPRTPGTVHVNLTAFAFPMDDPGAGERR